MSCHSTQRVETSSTQKPTPERVGLLRGFLVSDTDDAVAEAFAVGAMQYSFLDPDVSTGPTSAADDGSTSAFAQLLKRTQYRP